VAGARRGGSTGSAPSPGPGLPSAGSAENFLAAERRQASLAGWLLVGRLPFLLAGLLCPACWLSPSQALLPLFDFLALGSQPTPRCKPGELRRSDGPPLFSLATGSQSHTPGASPGEPEPTRIISFSRRGASLFCSLEALDAGSTTFPKHYAWRTRGYRGVGAPLAASEYNNDSVWVLRWLLRGQRLSS